MMFRNSSPFTATQWQELEHQALIFKYMMAGIPIPPDLIYSVKNSLMDSSSSSLSAAARLFSHQSPVGWGCFQVGFGRKTDPEPGRCRRTDGKKWRCSKEAYPDSKYCERHMHRGKNRSRKPVELPTTTTSLPSLSQPPQQSLSSFSLYPSLSSSSQSSSSIETSHHPYYHNNSNNYNQNQNSSSPVFPFLYPPLQSSCSSVSRPPPSSDFSSQNNNSTTTHQLFLDSSSNYSHQSDKDYRYFNGMRESLDERVFFPEASGTLIRSLQHQQEQQEQQQQQQQHCFVLGTDFKSSMIKAERNDNNNNDIHHDDETQKQMHHFFSEWPQKNRDSWLDLEDHDDPSSTRTHSSFSSATQLSISLPMSASHHDPFAPHSRLHPDG